MIFFKDTEKKIIKELTEYYFVKNVTYIIRLSPTANFSLFDYISHDSNFKKYEKITKKIVDRFIYVNDQLVDWTDANNTRKKPNEKLIREGKRLLHQKRLIIENIVMD